MNDVVKRIVPSPVFIRPVAALIKQHVTLTMYECHLMQLYSNKGKVSITGVPLPSSGFSSDAAGKSENTQKRECFKHHRSKQERGS